MEEGKDTKGLGLQEVLLNVADRLSQWSRNNRFFKASSEARLWAMRQKRLKILGFKVSAFKCLPLELRLQICHQRKVEKFVRFSRELTMRRVEFNQEDGLDRTTFFSRPKYQSYTLNCF